MSNNEIVTVRTVTTTVSRVETSIMIEMIDRDGNVISSVPGGNFAHTNTHVQTHTHEEA